MIMARVKVGMFLFMSVLFLGLVRAQEGRVELVPAMFIFGDSLIDNGNNNNIPTFARADYYPYGIDFDGGATGRFSNGLTMVDAIAELLGLPLIPAYRVASGQEILHGINYASAAAGILDITGRNFVGRIPFNQQLQNFQNTLDQLAMQLGSADEVASSIARCIFFVGFGSNDYINNYVLPNYNTRNMYNGQQYANLLAQQYTKQLTSLYNLGARKVVISGVGMLGCTPNSISQTVNGRCSDYLNGLVVLFNTNLRSMVNTLNTNLPGAKFIYIDAYNLFSQVLTNFRSYGFSISDRGCCGIGRNRGQITCLPFQTPCPNRDQYVFWDAFHPTEAVNIILAREAFGGSTAAAYPINIEKLAKL